MARPLPATFCPTEQSLITHHTELLTLSLNKQHVATCPHFERQSIQSTIRSSPIHISSIQLESVHSVHTSKPVNSVHNSSQSIKFTLLASPLSPHSQPVHPVHTSSQSTLPASPFCPHFQPVHSVHTSSQSILSTLPVSPLSSHFQPVHSVHTSSQSIQSTLPASPVHNSRQSILSTSWIPLSLSNAAPKTRPQIRRAVRICGKSSREQTKRGGINNLRDRRSFKAHRRYCYCYCYCYCCCCCCCCCCCYCYCYCCYHYR